MRPDGNLFRGGAELMIERTKAELEKLGCKVEILTPHTRALGDIVHFFGCYDSHWSTASIALGKGKRYVCSPIFSTGRSATQTRLRAYRHRLARRFPRSQYELLKNASRLVVQTNREKNRVSGYFGIRANHFEIIPHGVDERFATGDPLLFRTRYGITAKYVLSTGAFTSGKNRLNLIRAMNGTGVSLVIAGNVVDQENYLRCKQEADGNVRLVEGIPHESDLLPSAYAAADAFSLPSYYETFCLSAMEAEVAGCSLVLGDRWGGDEIYGLHAEYVNPDDVGGIRRATLVAFERGKQDCTQAQHFLNQYRWDVVTRRLAQVYERVLA